MKKITILTGLLITALSFSSRATVLTVSNSPISGGQYTDIQSALTAAALDDTVYVNGSGVTYPAATITKRVTLVGAGYAPAGTQYNMPTTVTSITIDTGGSFGFPVSGTHIIGLSTGITCNIITTGIHIERCYGSIYYVRGDGWVIENNVITTLYTYMQSTSSFIVRNNFFIGDFTGAYTLNGAGLIIDHNIFQGHINNVNFCVISNNIFFFAGIAASSTNGFNTFNDNITIFGSPDVVPFGTNSGTGNHNNLTPSTVYANGVTQPATYPALLTTDWHVLNASVGHNGASDGSDIGIFGGANPMPNFTGASTLPQMTLLNISNTSIPLNGTINFEFKARKQN